MSSENVVETDVLVIGGGTAGCFAAIKAKEQGLNVTIVDKAYAGRSGAGGGQQVGWSLFNADWGLDFDAAMNFINSRGEYINNREWGEVVLNESFAAYQELVSWGVQFPPVQFGGPFPFGNIFMTPVRRTHVLVMRKQAEKVGVRFINRIMVTDLLKEDGKVTGAIGFSYDTGDLHIFKSKATILCAGSNSLKPPGFQISMLTGDADAMAYRAGAEITGKEFPDNHPTTAKWPAWTVRPYIHITDAVGESLPDYANLPNEFAIHAGKGPIVANPDIASGELDEFQIKAADDEYAAMTRERMGIDVVREGKHQLAGGTAGGYIAHGNAGIWVINTKCATNLTGLYAAGDCCGARISGGAPAVGGLAPASVTGRRAGLGAAEYALQAKKPAKIDQVEVARLKKIIYMPKERKGGFSPRWVTQLLQNIMMPYFILFIKNQKRSQAALTIVEFLRDQLVSKLTAKDAHELRLAHETKNMVLNAEMILRASLFRTESRCTHYREDYPRRDDPAWLVWVKWKETQGEMKPSKEPVPKEWWPDLSKPYEERYPGRFPGE